MLGSASHSLGVVWRENVIWHVQTLACSDPMKVALSPTNLTLLCALCCRSRGLAQEGWPCAAQLVLPPVSAMGLGACVSIKVPHPALMSAELMGRMPSEGTGMGEPQEKERHKKPLRVPNGCFWVLVTPWWGLSVCL